MTTETIPSVTALPLAYLINQKMPFYVNIITSSGLPDGYLTIQEPFKTYSQIGIQFRIYNSGDSWFPYNLGSGFTASDTYTCEIYGVENSPFGVANCALVVGPSLGATNADVATVDLVDYNTILEGSSISFNFPMTYCASKNWVRRQVYKNIYGYNKCIGKDTHKYLIKPFGK